VKSVVTQVQKTVAMLTCKPFSVRLDASIGYFSGLKSGGLCDFTHGITLGLAFLEAIEQLNLFGITVEVFALSERLAQALDQFLSSTHLDFDIGHAIAEFSLALLSGAFFFAGAHGGV
jgi:hypothetical protein